MATNNFITKAGLKPNESCMPYRITTDDVKNYLQNAFNEVVAVARKKGIQMSDIDIQLYSNEYYSKKFVPFVLLLPLSVLVNGGDQENDDVNDILACAPKDNDLVRVNQIIYNFISTFTFDSSDRQFFKSNSFKMEYGITYKKSAELINATKIRVQHFGNGKYKLVSVLLDPIRLFYAMTQVEGDTRHYSISINEINRLRRSSHAYNITRSIIKPNSGGKDYDIIASEIEKHGMGK